MKVRQSLQDRLKTAAEISREKGETSGGTVSRFTVLRRLKEAGLIARTTAQKPLISKKNQKTRLQFAQQHVLWSAEQWAKVHFPDESKFNLIGFDGKKYVRHKLGERLSVKCVKKTVKFGGGSVMVWGVISAAGSGPLVRLHGRVNAAVHKELLQQHAVPYLRAATAQPPIFMQDYAPCLEAKSVTTFLTDEGIAVMNWPPQSPDLNPIENIWKIVGERAQAKNPENKDKLWIYLKEEWEKLTPDFCNKLIGSCSKRMQ